MAFWGLHPLVWWLITAIVAVILLITNIIVMLWPLAFLPSKVKKVKAALDAQG